MSMGSSTHVDDLLLHSTLDASRCGFTVWAELKNTFSVVIITLDGTTTRTQTNQPTFSVDQVPRESESRVEDEETTDETERDAPLGNQKRVESLLKRLPHDGNPREVVAIVGRSTAWAINLCECLCWFMWFYFLLLLLVFRIPFPTIFNSRESEPEDREREVDTQ